jgi:hypothetical protein
MPGAHLLRLPALTTLLCKHTRFCYVALHNMYSSIPCFCAWLQEFRAFSHGGKPKVLVMSYPCFRMHKAEVYRMGLDVVSTRAGLLLD